MYFRRDLMFFSKKVNDKSTPADVAMQEFSRLWNEELLKTVDSRDFSKVYNFALRKYAIRDNCLKTYFDFSSENSIRYKEACDAFDEGDIFWTYMLIRQFASVPGCNTYLKHLTNKRRAFLNDKRKESVITRYSVRTYLHNLMRNSEKVAEDFIASALIEKAQYEEFKTQQKYKSAYKIAALTDKTTDYASNMKKYLYYAAKREITPQNLAQTNEFFEYVRRYFSFKRKLKGGGHILIDDIDVVIALLVFYRNGGNVTREEVISAMHRSVKVYCTESTFPPVCLLADYLYQIGETDMEQMVLKLLVRYGEAISDRYKKRHTCLELMSKNSNKFIFRHKPHTPLECIDYNGSEPLKSIMERCIATKEKNSWCIAVKHDIKTYEFSYKYFYDDKILSILETVLDNEFGDFVLEYSMRTYFEGDSGENAKHSMIIFTSGKNQYSDFPKIGILVKIEPITKKFVNVHYATLYLPEEEYTSEEIDKDCEFIESVISEESDARFKTFSSVIENHVWNTVNEMMNSQSHR